MPSYHIVEVSKELETIRKEYSEITNFEKGKLNKFHKIPRILDWNDGYLWWCQNNWNNNNVSNPFYVFYSAENGVLCSYTQKWLKFCIRKNATDYQKDIIQFFINEIIPYSPSCLYSFTSIYSLINKIFDNCSQEGYYVSTAFILNTLFAIPFLHFDKDNTELHSIQYQQLIDLTESYYDRILRFQNEKIEKFNHLRDAYKFSEDGISNYLTFLLEDSFYSFLFKKGINMEYKEDTSTLIIDYTLPNKNEIPNEVVNKNFDWNRISSAKETKMYETLNYTITLRTLAEICHYDDKRYINHICFNGKIKDRSPVTGQMEEKYILSVNVNREQIESLNLEFIDPKECFKRLKGVSASKLYEYTEIRPIITPSFIDKRFVKSKDVDTDQYTNLAEMDWEEFEHLVRQVFEWEFSDKGGEVNVTQSSRDGGVDAIVFDPDPIRGGKIIIQAKRYTNTVSVSAVRDLYGTIINEGANKGILITTSDYGPDSYKFAQGKPITLLNGGHLLYLMEKHGRHARIDIQEAKNKNKGIN
ncbi:MAG: restriction endonuclease [Muribaculaceae bacterium]|nr:restriction endonuclease [Muribaculaceae bacterium]